MKKRLFCLLMSIMMLCTIMPAVSVGADTTDVLPWKTLIATENFDYATGTTLTSGTLNGGTGFSGAWYRGAGSYDSSISENGAYKYLKCDGSTVTSNRILTDAIDTVNDGTYVVTFMLRESANETKQQNLKVGFTDSSNVSLDADAPLFAGVCYDAVNEKYCYQLSVNGETVLADVNYGFWSFWGKNMMLKVKIDVDADGIDTVSAKGWCPEKGDAEPNDWTMTVNSELSELNLNAVDYRIYGGASHLGALNIVKYNYDITYENATLEEYKNLANVTDEEELAERINVLAQNGFFYDDLKDYSGALQANTGLWNSGAGFSGAWFAQGSMDGSVPGIVENSGNFIKNYYASTHIKRDLAYPINTTKDGEYYLSFEMYDNGSPDEFPAINNKLVFTDKATAAQNLYVGICLTDDNEYRFQLGIGEDKVLSTEKFTAKEEILTKKIKFKVRLSIDEDAVDTVYMKAWMSGNAEPADWSCVKTAELSGYTLNQIAYTNSSTTALFGKVYMESYIAEDIRELYSSIDNADADTIESVKTQINEYISGLAKEDMILKADSLTFEIPEPWKTVLVTENFDYTTGTALTSGTLNGGTGFNGAWYRGAGDYDSSISENESYKYLKCDGSTVTNNRKLYEAIDTVNDGMYEFTFVMRESASETKAQNHKVGFINSSEQLSTDVAPSVYAGFCYNPQQDNYGYQLVVGDNVKYFPTSYGFWSLYGKEMTIKVKITVDADGIDNIAAKGWFSGKGEAEPAGWSMSTDAELSDFTFDAIDYRVYGGAAHLRGIELAKYRSVVKYDNATLDDYNMLSEITDEEELTERISALAEKGFFYDDLTAYSGALQANKDLWNSGAGFSGAWFAQGSMDGSVPGIVENSGNFIKNYYASTHIKRDLAYPINTTKDGEYYLSFEMYDNGSPDEFPAINNKLVFTDKATAAQNLYAGICLTDDNEYRFQLGIGEDKVLSTEKFTAKEEILTKKIKFKVRLSIDEDAVDTVYMKAWMSGNAEPADWSCVKTAELSGYTLNQIAYTNSSTTALFGKVLMEGYNAEDVRTLYSKIDSVTLDTYQSVKSEISNYISGLAKEDMLLKISGNMYTDATLEYYNDALKITDEAQKTERISALAKKGFFYEDFETYSGTFQQDKASWNGGAGFTGTWHSGGEGSTDAMVPSIAETENGKFLKNYYKATPLKRDMEYNISTTKDGEYYLYFEMYDTGNSLEPPTVDTKVGLVDKNVSSTNQTLYAGLGLTTGDEYHFKLGVGEDVVLSDEKYTDFDDILRKQFSFKLRISVDADGIDTVYMKAWQTEKEEPASWTCVKEAELSKYTLNQIAFTNNGTTAFLGKVYMESYEPTVLRAMYSKVDEANEDTYELIKEEFDLYLNGLAKDDMIKKVMDKAPKELIGLSFNFKNADGCIIEKLTADMTSVSGEWIIKNTLGRDYDVMPLIAVYDKSTKKLEKVALVEGNTYPVPEGDEVTVSVTLDEISLSEGKIVRAFLWKADGSIAPLCKDASIDFSGSVIPEFDEAVRIFVDETATNEGNGDITAPF